MIQDPDRNPVEVLAEEFVARTRNGEDPNIHEYVAQHPDLATEIEALFPTVVAMEQLKARKLAPTSPIIPDSPHPKRLGDFRIIREIGRGGMGIVYEAEQESLARRVALKTLPQKVLSDSARLTRFKHESQTAARLHHTNIVPVFGVGEHEGLHYYVMQYIRGIGLDEILRQLRMIGSTSGSASTFGPRDEATTGTLHSVRPAADAARALHDGRFMQGVSYLSDSLSAASITAIGTTTDVPLNEETAQQAELDAASSEDASVPYGSRYWKSIACIGSQVAEALNYAHTQGTLHRDIKPANLLLDAQGTVWITDFGLAKATEPGQQSSTADIVGTLRYMAPEQFSGTLDSSSDVYSLGATLYEMLALQPAFDDSDRGRLVRRVTQEDPIPLRRINPNIPRDLATIVHKAMAKERQNRYATAADLAEDLARFQANLPIRARRVLPPERLWRWARRNPTIAALSLCLLLVFAGSFAAVTLLFQQERTSHTAARQSGRRAESNLDLALDWIDDILSPFSAHWVSDPLEQASEEEELPEQPVQPQVAISEGNLAMLQKALTFYDQLVKENVGHPRLRRDSARANRRIGDIRHRLGDFAEAEKAYRRAIKLLEQLAQDFPNETEHWRAASATYRRLGVSVQMTGRLKVAEKAYRRSLAILDEQNRTKLADQFERAKTLNTLGRMLWRSKLKEREAYHRQALELLDGLIRNDRARTSRHYKHLQARCYRDLVGIERRRRRSRRRTTKPTPVQSFDSREKAVTILDQLVADFPEIPDYQCDLSEILCNVRLSSRRLKDPDYREQVERDLVKSINLAQSLTEQFPSITRYTWAHIHGNRQLGELLQRTERTKNAILYLRSALKSHETLSSKFPSSFIQSTRASMLLTLGKVMRSESDLVESERLLREALALQKNLPSRNANAKLAEYGQVRFIDALATTLEKLEQDEEAQQLRLQAAEIRHRVRQHFQQLRKKRQQTRKSSTPNA